MGMLECCAPVVILQRSVKGMTIYEVFARSRRKRRTRVMLVGSKGKSLAQGADLLASSRYLSLLLLYWMEMRIVTGVG